jgi:peptidoglycan/xylan/chitin deacetylase (PgdA/CDA1 family)
MSRALLLTYHAVESGAAPLCVEPGLFARHLDAIAASGADVLTVRELAAALRGGCPPAHAVVVTFDDGYASVVANAAPLLRERRIAATIFCVAGRLGGDSAWPSQARWAAARPLAGAADLAVLVEAWWEVGSHGVQHDVLSDARELAESRALLEAATGADVKSFAYPYGVVPPGAADALAAAGYEAACAARAGVVDADADPFFLPRVDAHYVRDPRVLRAVLAGRAGPYLRARAAAARMRRLVRKDYVAA